MTVKQVPLSRLTRISFLLIDFRCPDLTTTYSFASVPIRHNSEGRWKSKERGMCIVVREARKAGCKRKRKSGSKRFGVGCRNQLTDVPASPLHSCTLHLQANHLTLSNALYCCYRPLWFRFHEGEICVCNCSSKKERAPDNHLCSVAWWYSGRPFVFNRSSA